MALFERIEIGTRDGEAGPQALYCLGTDVGGTFTDFVFMDEKGGILCRKVQSTPSIPAESTMTGVDEILSSDLNPGMWSQLRHTHSSTIATNALIERTGARVGLLINEGFRDVLELQRFSPPRPGRFDSRRPLSLVPRRLVAEIRCRMNAAGKEVTELDEASVLAAAQMLRESGCEVIAVCLLHSYTNSAHEQRVKALIEESFPDVIVELSSQVWPQAREYERGMLTVMNCYIRPVIHRYIDGIIAGIGARRVKTEARIARSNGGAQRAATIRQMPIVTALSGPAAGLTAAFAAATAAGWSSTDLVTMDVGGTSADVGIVRAGSPILSSEEHVAAFPLLLPTAAVSVIGAGGGSIIWADEAGALKIGPRSVGANPGPACYNSGSTIPSLTDAFVVSGLLGADQKLGDRITINAEAARTALGTIANTAGSSIESVADGAIAVAIAVMATEVTKMLAKHGTDAPNFRMVAFGGAGPMVGALVAEEAHLPAVLIPPHPGALAAFGAALSSIEGDLVEPVYVALDDLSPEAAAMSFKALRERSVAWLQSELAGTFADEVFIEYKAEMRYDGQGFDVGVPVSAAWLERFDRERLMQAFHEEHRKTYGYENLKSRARLQELRAHPVARIKRAQVYPPQPTTFGQPCGHRRMRLRGETLTANVYRRDEIGAGQIIHEPAILIQMDTTTIVPTGWKASAVQSGAIVLSRL